MARLTSIGFELNSLTANVEITSIQGAGISIDSTTVRSGTYSLRTTSFESGSTHYTRYIFSSADTNGPIYTRSYFRAATLPTIENTITQLRSSSGVRRIYVTLDNSGTLRFYD